MSYPYPARLEADEEGRLVVHFPDLPEALTDGADRVEAVAEAADCLSEALGGRSRRGEEIPLPSPLRDGLYAIAPEPTISFKAGLDEAVRKKGISITELARRRQIGERGAGSVRGPR